MHSITWDLPTEAWSAFLARCPRATFFHTPEWYAAHARTAGYRPHPALIQFEDGSEALLPLATRPRFRGLIQEALAGIENGYGGLVSPLPLSREAVESAYQLVRMRFPDLTVVGNPFEAYDNLPGATERETDATQVLAIRPMEDQSKLMSETRAKQIKRAKKAGFEIEVLHPVSAADALRFYPLYAERASEWAYTKWMRDEAYFRALCDKAGSKLALFLASKDGELAGFRLLGLHGPVVMDLFLATAKAHEPAHVGPLLVGEPLRWCHEHGYDMFDFQPSGRLEGVKAYKASFGAASLPHGTTRQGGLVGRTLGTLHRLSARTTSAISAAG
jgi:CelD/BcsL family acetyltransferase involved in cellulose biosynthesis